MSPRQVNDNVIRTSPNVSRAVILGVAALFVGLVLVTAATPSRPGPRLSRKARLVDLIRAENARTGELRRQLAALRAEVAALTDAESSRTKQLASVQRLADALAPYAGSAAVHGPGLSIEMRDSSLRESPTGDPNDLVIHEQDLQAVVNALWASGAEAVAINGERITAESAIRCVGNTLLLHGSVYGPPYRIAAIGNAPALRAGLDGDLLVTRFRDAVEDFRLGFDLRDAERLDLPAFGGAVGEQFAEAA